MKERKLNCNVKLVARQSSRGHVLWRRRDAKFADSSRTSKFYQRLDNETRRFISRSSHTCPLVLLRADRVRDLNSTWDEWRPSGDSFLIPRLDLGPFSIVPDITSRQFDLWPCGRYCPFSRARY